MNSRQIASFCFDSWDIFQDWEWNEHEVKNIPVQALDTPHIFSLAPAVPCVNVNGYVGLGVGGSDRSSFEARVPCASGTAKVGARHDFNFRLRDRHEM